MVMGVPHKLKQWWKNIRRAHRDGIRTHFGALTSLLNFRDDMVLTKLLVEFWDPAKAVFKFVDCEITPVLEEIISFTKLPFTERRTILLVVMPGHRFQYAFGIEH